MTRVLLALLPIALSSITFFGWRVLLLLVVVNAAAFAAEYAFTRRWKQPASAAVFVSGSLFALSLPPLLPVWMAVVGIVFGIVFGKMVFGGFGKNIFNPALTGRAFIYVSFGRHMTGEWYQPVDGALGGPGAYAADAVTQATPCMMLKTGEAVPMLHLLLGNTSGVIGGTSAILVLLGGLYLVWKKAANHRIVVGCLGGYLVTQTILWAAGFAGVARPLHALLAGSVLFGIFFYATDPVSGPTTQQGRWIYGVFIGMMSSLITVFSAWPEGTMFAILLANMFAPIMDHAIKAIQAKKK
ncbi:MAG: RnfABCDGE type electron transport complex subunit D [Kiritimatiellae bacterium]|nr:RnfABCDGE type electron transport complex subunit D [Kiritimatiellia bacterium]